MIRVMEMSTGKIIEDEFGRFEDEVFDKFAPKILDDDFYCTGCERSLLVRRKIRLLSDVRHVRDHAVTFISQPFYNN